ncbi:simple sugar transport system substrate-binding protein/ribose transport system substrate-binding protein [Nakamurella sp. UYEF19]|uniref:sugar ABC transporter substrate-binding protein n=1 Tax=Nakamurella sp. UYEF19 TaxID=1756392 RepID=UPI00339B1435
MKLSKVIVALTGVAVLTASLVGCGRDSTTAATTSSVPSSAVAPPATSSSSSTAGSVAPVSSASVGRSSVPASSASASSPSSSAGPSAGGSPLVGVDQPRSDSDFWSAYAKFVPQMATTVGVTLQNTASDNDANKLKSNVDTLIAKGVKSLVIAPQDTAAVAPALAAAAKANIPVVSVDTRPDAGKVYMVVRADNRAYGTNACIFLGEKLGNKGTVVEFQGALASINGRDRSEAFASCMKEKYAGIKVIAIPTEWSGDKAASGLQDALVKEGTINGIYMQAGGVFLEPTLALLKRENKLVPAGQPGHVTIVSNDGIASELKAIGNGEIDATVSQPADSYAKWALFYAKAAVEGKTLAPGRTDHDSTIISTPNGLLEDQLPAPVVTKDGAAVGSLTTVKFDSKDLWGNGS